MCKSNINQGIRILKYYVFYVLENDFNYSSYESRTSVIVTNVFKIEYEPRSLMVNGYKSENLIICSYYRELFGSYYLLIRRTVYTMYLLLF